MEIKNKKNKDKVIILKYGYARVSTKDQNTDRQLEALIESGVDEQKIFVDKATGSNFDRVAYKEMIETLKRNDEIFVKSIDRLGRDYDEIIQQWNIITKKIEADIVVLDFPLLDTREKIDSLTGKFLSDMVLQVLSYVAEIEKDNIKQRQREGIRIAKEKGIKFGRPKNKRPKNYDKVEKEWREGKISLREGAKKLKISHTTFYSWIKKDDELYEKKNVFPGHKALP